jgi:uncharacterized membrane protein YukC
MLLCTDIRLLLPWHLSVLNRNQLLLSFYSILYHLSKNVKWLTLHWHKITQVRNVQTCKQYNPLSQILNVTSTNVAAMQQVRSSEQIHAVIKEILPSPSYAHVIFYLDYFCTLFCMFCKSFTFALLYLSYALSMREGSDI